jgi:glycerol-3-phosphate dehydrogenase
MTSPTDTEAWRDTVWARLGDPWDLVVVGGGVTGAGILRLAARRGLRALLVEQRDIAWGTSSRSSKLVHGGLRYLKQAQLRLTYESVRQRERLLHEAPGLVEPLGFLMPNYRGDRTGPTAYRAGLTLYDLLAGRRTHRRHDAADFLLLAPHLRPDGLLGGFAYDDAQTDDARLTLRVVGDAIADGAEVLTYARADALLHGPSGRVAGIVVRDTIGDRSVEVRSPIVVNATGAWADGLRGDVGARPRIRPLRGSHLVFPLWRVPVAQAISVAHPVDQRPLFLFPWEGAAIFGTTDVDHGQPLDEEPRISADEIGYLMEALAARFPSLDLTPGDAISSFAGVRPVVGSGRADPSAESRDHVVWDERGLLTVTGGKLTTFGLIARDALAALRDRLPAHARRDTPGPILDPAPPAPTPIAASPGELGHGRWRRLAGRYGAAAPRLVAAARPGELESIPGTSTPWAELRWAARAERVVHLEDLLLRRTRLGLLVPNGAIALLPRIREICGPELGWDDTRWAAEQIAYETLWRHDYAPPR